MNLRDAFRNYRTPTRHLRKSKASDRDQPSSQRLPPTAETPPPLPSDFTALQTRVEQRGGGASLLVRGYVIQAVSYAPRVACAPFTSSRQQTRAPGKIQPPKEPPAELPSLP